nr:immunoglobulin light chain junction region [Macaca mulatta]
CQNGYGFPLTF